MELLGKKRVRCECRDMHGVTANRDTPLRGGITKDEKINTSRIGKKIEKRKDEFG